MKESNGQCYDKVPLCLIAELAHSDKGEVALPNNNKAGGFAGNYKKKLIEYCPMDREHTYIRRFARHYNVK